MGKKEQDEPFEGKTNLEQKRASNDLNDDKIKRMEKSMKRESFQDSQKDLRRKERKPYSRVSPGVFVRAKDGHDHPFLGGRAHLRRKPLAEQTEKREGIAVKVHEGGVDEPRGAKGISGKETRTNSTDTVKKPLRR